MHFYKHICQTMSTSKYPTLWLNSEQSHGHKLLGKICVLQVEAIRDISFLSISFSHYDNLERFINKYGRLVFKYNLSKFMGICWYCWLYHLLILPLLRNKFPNRITINLTYLCLFQHPPYKNIPLIHWYLIFLL